jgi:hypothetical protein
MQRKPAGVRPKSSRYMTRLNGRATLDERIGCVDEYSAVPRWQTAQRVLDQGTASVT